MRVNGLQSQVVKELRQADATSVAVGKFQHAVEILYIEPYKETTAQQMEVEVLMTQYKNLTLHELQSLLLCTYLFSNIFIFYTTANCNRWYVMCEYLFLLILWLTQLVSKIM